MLESRIIEIDGTFLGTVILEADRQTRRFYAAHDSVRAFHNHTLQGPDDVALQVARLYRRAHANAGRATSTRQPRHQAACDASEAGGRAAVRNSTKAVLKTF
ncbi:hypothetical protein H845_1185 [Komagataeibacter xylinus E25]|nr:hypothetical protein H845_1185 [Komagataeibacter xylinus E25]